jgi:hypothetical protein
MKNFIQKSGDTLIYKNDRLGGSMHYKIVTLVNRFIRAEAHELGSDYIKELYTRGGFIAFGEYEILMAHLLEGEVLLTVKTKHGGFDLTIFGKEDVILRAV